MRPCRFLLPPRLHQGSLATTSPLPMPHLVVVGNPLRRPESSERVRLPLSHQPRFP